MKTLQHSTGNAVVAMGQGETIENGTGSDTRRDAAAEERARDEAHQSPDPLRKTDRYRLVTPYFSSIRDL